MGKVRYQGFFLRLFRLFFLAGAVLAASGGVCAQADSVNGAAAVYGMETFYEAGTGTREDPYRIAAPDQLLSWQRQVEETGAAGQYFLLTEDVDISSLVWEPAGSETQPFQGVFDGGGHRISGIHMVCGRSYCGLVGYNKGTVEHVTLEGELHMSGQAENVKYVGGAAGFNTGVIQDVISRMDISAESAQYVGGIAGFQTSGKWMNGTSREEIPQSTGLIQRCKNEGRIAGYRVTGGIVGENAGIVDRCGNSGEIVNQQQGRGSGTGGIAGRNGNTDLPYETGIIISCFNTGVIDMNGGRWGGSLCGWANSFSVITNCYAAGTILTGYDDWAPLFPRSDGGETVDNCYSLEGLPNCSPSNAKRTGIIRTSGQMKSGDFPGELGAAFQQDTQNQNQGYPILRWQAGSQETAVLGLEADLTGARTDYYEGDTFRMEGIRFYAVHEDGSRELISPYYYTADKSVLSLGDNGTVIHITCSAYGMEQAADVAVSVAEKTLTGITVSQGPAKFVYEEGEAFDTAALKIRASYADGTTEIVSGGFTCDTNGPLSPSNRTVTVSYTVNQITMTDSFEVIAAGARTEPARDGEGVYCLETAEDMLWFSEEVNIRGNTGLHVRLGADIDLRGVPEFTPVGRYGSQAVETANGGKLTYHWENKFQGVLDGGKKTVTLALEGDSCTALVGNASGAVVQNLTVKGSVRGRKGYTAGIIARGSSITLSGCTNQAEISFEGENIGLAYTAGIIGMAENASVTDCRNQGRIVSTGGLTAGIAGDSQGDCSYERCQNLAAVAGVGNYAAGIAARGASLVLVDCDNLGDVRGSAGYVGGIAGGSTQNLTVERCSSLGSITGGTMAGGILGGGLASSITDSYNKGPVALNGNAGGSAGGIVGKKGNAPLSITGCYNTGKISAPGGAAGDLAGDASSGNKANGMHMANCYYAGKQAAGKDKNVSGTAKRRTAAQLSQMAGTLGGAYQNSCTGAVFKRQTAKSHAYGSWSPKNLAKVGEHKRSCKNCGLIQTKTVCPKGTAITRLSKKGKTLKVTWKKQSGQIKGYQIQYAGKADFSGKKGTVSAGRKKTAAVLKKIKPSKRYYVRIRTCQVVKNKKYYSDWSKVKTVK